MHKVSIPLRPLLRKSTSATRIIFRTRLTIWRRSPLRFKDSSLPKLFSQTQADTYLNETAVGRNARCLLFRSFPLDSGFILLKSNKDVTDKDFGSLSAFWLTLWWCQF
ncbi:hypothetical protein AVEN_240321-1 [Araneus ventricosus]|uniref:Uncharacterized protein n=1 Tax=Araneus ventricosus TaxID=182803 RepID=A0A4Y2RJF0_ARAVE|nr:hypothetical protein AVEN_240321-1 [Araneus ventricosus]